MNISCDIIRDLLPLYADDVCSPASRGLVEEHVQCCEGCAKELRLMRAGLPCDAAAVEVDSAKAAKKAWRKRKLKYVVLGLLIAAVVLGGLYGLTQPNVVPVDETYLEVPRAYRMESGAFYLELTVTDGMKHNFIKYEMVGDGYYITPMQPIITSEEHPDFVARKNSTEHVVAHPDMKALYVGWGEDAVLVWEEGMDLPDAPADIEEWYAELRGE